MPQDPLIQALRAELDVALSALGAAHRMLADYERGERAAEKARRRAGAATPDNATLRTAGMGVAEAAAVLGIGPDRVRAMLRQNELPGVDFGGRVGWRIDREEVHLAAERLETQRRGRVLARDARLRGHGPR